MRFVSPETTRIPLPDGEWIEVKNDLSAIEEKKFRAAGFKRLSQRKTDDEPQSEVEIDWAELAFARVFAYLTDWSAKDEKGKKIAVSKDAIRQLVTEDFDAIDAAIQAHIAARTEEKKTTTGPASLTVSAA